MIIRSLLFSCGLALVYAMAVGYFAAGIPRVGPTQHQSNIIRIERVWHRAKSADALLVGTSLAARLPDLVINQQIDSIAQSATGPMTGLLLADILPTPPRSVYVEVNMFHQGVDHEALAYFSRQPMAALREFVPILRQSEQPINLLISALLAQHAEPAIIFDPNKLRFGLDYLASQNQQTLSVVVLETRLVDFKKVLTSLRSKGIHIVLVEFPLHPEVRNSPRYIQSFDALSAAFPASEWEWVHPPAASKWEFTDGLHLTTASAVDFAQLLLTDIQTRRTSALRLVSN